MGLRDQMGDFGGSPEKDETYKFIIPRKGLVEVPKIDLKTKQSHRVFFRVLDLFDVYHGVRFWLNSGLVSQQPGKEGRPIEIPFMSDRPYKEWLGNAGKFLYKNDQCMLSQLAQKGSRLIAKQKRQGQDEALPKIEHISALAVQILRVSPSTPKDGGTGKRIAPFTFDVDEQPYLWEFKNKQWSRFLDVVEPKDDAQMSVDELGGAIAETTPKKLPVEEYAKQKGISLDQVVFCVYRKLDPKFKGSSDSDFAAPFVYDYIVDTKLTNPALPPKSAWIDVSKAYRKVTQEDLKGLSGNSQASAGASDSEEAPPSAGSEASVQVPASAGASTGGGSITPLKAEEASDDWG